MIFLRTMLFSNKCSENWQNLDQFLSLKDKFLSLKDSSDKNAP